MVYASYDLIEEAVPWDFEVNPSTVLLTIKLSLDDILNIPVWPLQYSTIPVEESDSTVSPIIKSFGLRSTLNWGKYFSGMILPLELIASKFPGIVPASRLSRE